MLRRTNKLVAVAPLPDNVSAAGDGANAEVEASALRAEQLPLGRRRQTVPLPVVPAPFARRVDFVFLRFLLPDDEVLFSASRGYALAAPVAALLAYDVSSGPNGSEIALRALGAPVRVDFGNLSLSSPSFNDTGAARCVTFAAASGKAVATHAMASPTACAVTGTGHYGVAVRLEVPPPTPTPAAVKERWWASTVVAGAGGVVAVSFLAVTVAAAVRWNRRRRREEMEVRAMAGEELGRMAVRGSRMPSAKMVRTGPELDEGSPLPWRR